MENMLSDLLNIRFRKKKITKVLNLPYYLSKKKMEVYYNDVISFCLVFIEDEYNIVAIKRQYDQYKNALNQNIALCIDVLNKRQRDALVKNHIPFIAPPNQLYLPFMGIYFTDKYITKKENISKFTPTGQALFLLFAYEPIGEKISKGEIANRLNVTRTSVTRASSELVQLELLKEEKRGKELFLYREKENKHYFKSASNYLINPVQEVLYIEKITGNLKCLNGGEAALSHYSMLNEPLHLVKSCYKKDVSDAKIKTVDHSLLDYNEYITLQKWKYSPLLFSSSEDVDPISLYASMKDIFDERIESELDNMLKEKGWI